MIIRLIQKYTENGNTLGEIFWDEPNHKLTSVEKVCHFSEELLEEFLKDWSSLLHRVLTLPPNRIEFLEKLNLKSANLERVLFGKTELPWSKLPQSIPIQIFTDPKYSNIPIEILKSNQKFLFENKHFSRGIRTDVIQNYPSKKIKPKFLIVSNPIVPSIKDSIKMEVNKISGFIPKKWNLKILKESQISELKFLEEVSSANYIHYVGHSDPFGIPLLSGKKISSSSIERQNLSQLKISFLNSCYSGLESEGFSSLTTAFIKAGCEEVVGFLNPVETNTAQLIGANFWKKFQKSKNVQKTIFTLKSELFASDSLGMLAAISLVHFQKSKKESSKILLSFFYLFLISMSIFLFSYQLKKDSKSKNQLQNEETKKKSETLIENKKRKVETQENSKTSLLEREILNLENPTLKKQIYLFLHTAHPFLDQEQKENIVEEVLNSSEDEEVRLMNFKNKIGL